MIRKFFLLAENICYDHSSELPHHGCLDEGIRYALHKGTIRHVKTAMHGQSSRKEGESGDKKIYSSH